MDNKLIATLLLLSLLHCLKPLEAESTPRTLRATPSPYFCRMDAAIETRPVRLTEAGLCEPLFVAEEPPHVEHSEYGYPSLPTVRADGVMMTATSTSVPVIGNFRDVKWPQFE